MAEATLLTGKRGEGKTLIATMIAKRYIQQGRVVASNINFNLEHLAPAWNKTCIYRLPDMPTSADLKALPVANESYDESKNGLILLDETAGLFNSHDWRKEDTKEVRFWFAQSRKDGWDLLFLCQQEKQIDSQIRNSLFELHGIAKNMGKMGVPVISFLAQSMFGYKFRLPAFHVFTTRYGFSYNAPVANTEIIGGTDLYAAYDTKQKINIAAAEPGNPQEFGSAMATMLSAWYLKGRYQSRFKMYAKVALTMLFFGLVAGFPAGHFLWPEFNTKKPHTVSAPVSNTPLFEKSVFAKQIIRSASGFTLILTDSTVQTGTDFILNPEGEYYRAGSKWYKKEGL